MRRLRLDPQQRLITELPNHLDSMAITKEVHQRVHHASEFMVVVRDVQYMCYDSAGLNTTPTPVKANTAGAMDVFSRKHVKQKQWMRCQWGVTKIDQWGAWCSRQM